MNLNGADTGKTFRVAGKSLVNPTRRHWGKRSESHITSNIFSDISGCLLFIESALVPDSYIVRDLNQTRDNMRASVGYTLDFAPGVKHIKVKFVPVEVEFLQGVYFNTNERGVQLVPKITIPEMFTYCRCPKCYMVLDSMSNLKLHFKDRHTIRG